MRKYDQKDDSRILLFFQDFSFKSIKKKNSWMTPNIANRIVIQQQWDILRTFGTIWKGLGTLIYAFPGNGKIGKIDSKTEILQDNFEGTLWYQLKMYDLNTLS